MAKTLVQERAKLIKALLKSGEIRPALRRPGTYVLCDTEGYIIYIHLETLEETVNAWLTHQFKSKEN